MEFIFCVVNKSFTTECVFYNDEAVDSDLYSNMRDVEGQEYGRLEREGQLKRVIYCTKLIEDYC